MADPDVREALAKLMWQLECKEADAERKIAHLPPVEKWADPWLPSGTGVRQQQRYISTADAILSSGLVVPAGALDQFRAPLAELPPGPWKTWTSNSFRRISGPDGRDGGVLHALNQRPDGHPDLSWTEYECKAICAIVNGLRALVQPASVKEAGDA